MEWTIGLVVWQCDVGVDRATEQKIIELIIVESTDTGRGRATENSN